MNVKSRDEIRDIIRKDILTIRNRNIDLFNQLDEDFNEQLAYLRDVVDQFSQPRSGPFVAKTPKAVRKKAMQRIETIPEDEVFTNEDTSKSFLLSVNEEKQEASQETGRKSKRRASKKAADNIKKQSEPYVNNSTLKKTNRESRNKRKISNSSDEDDTRSGVKYSKLDDNLETKGTTRRITQKKSEQIVQPTMVIDKVKEIKNNKGHTSKSPKLQRSTRSKSKSSQNGEANKVDDKIVPPNIDDIDETSIYEDAMGKLVPIMNSTLKHSSVLPEKVLNATVVLERLPQQTNLNETVVIQKLSSARNSRISKTKTNTKKALQNSMQSCKEAVQYSDCNDLMTDDDSSLKIKKSKHANEKKNKKKLLSFSEDEIPNTPYSNCMKKVIAQDNKLTYKINALFSPYAKESVKKRVEAFEQAVIHSPKLIDVDPVRITRTKTRAMAAETEQKTADKNVAQILARKSLAKAKRISLAKQKKDTEEFKENKEQMPERINKLILNDKLNTKKKEVLKTTSLNKMKPLTSASRFNTPSKAQNLLNYPKALTASRTNIITSVDSFIQAPSSMSKSNSVEKLEEKKRHEEDVRKKRDEALRLQTEEKKRKRQEKELKNKLAREAKEKQEQEKRQKAEREREEKARLAHMMQEKQREEMEKKRHAQLQRAQEKEERRKLEEQQRLQKLQEQEEMERLLAEQRRQDQEAEKRKEMDARAQQAEVLKQKNQMAQAKYKQQTNKVQQGATNYVIDSEPDDESDDESRPKHDVPRWAQAHVRKMQLVMQRYIPQDIINKFFNTRKCTPDLTELFQNIDRTRLQRTSSAIWKTPPRISMMEID